MGWLTLVLVLSATAVAGAPSWAQTPRLPATSPSERHVNEINRSIAIHQQQLQQHQQTQFDVNRLRSDIQRLRQLPPATGPAIRSGCLPIGC